MFMGVKEKRPNRRDFLRNMGQSALALGMGASLPTIVPSAVLGQNAPSDKVNVGMIGMGWRGIQLMREALQHSSIQIAAVADLDRDFLLHGLQILDDQYEIDRRWIEGDGAEMVRPKLPEKAVEGYNDYRRLLERKDLDAVIIAVPDHWHAKTYIDAMQAGFDVYGEKPLCLTLNQGRNIVRVARETGRVFQTGSQQRSDECFRRGCEYVRSGRLGKLESVLVEVGGAPQTQAVPDEPVPPGLNWEMWQGPTELVPYNPQRCHVNFRWFFEYSGGMVTDWGAHHLDIAQWGLGMDGSGPSAVEGWAKVSPGYYNTFTSFEFTFDYPNDVKVYMKNSGNGVTFKGSKGEIFVNRGVIRATPEDLLNEPLKDSDVHLYLSNDHMQNWVDCLKSRELPICDVEIGHRSVSVCHIANICGWLGGRRLEWDPKQELFVNDREANGHLERPERAPYHHLS